MPRQSNVELLRIIAMLMIVVHHILVHGVDPLYGGDKIILYSDVPIVIGVNLFVLISVYFTIRLSWRSFLSLMWILVWYKLFHLAFDSFVLGVSHVWWHWIAKPLSVPVSGGGWFVDVYVLLMLVSPLLNKMLRILSVKEYKRGLLILLLIDCGYSFVLSLHFDSFGYSLMHFITLYYIGYGLRYLFVNFDWRKSSFLALLGYTGNYALLAIGVTLENATISSKMGSYCSPFNIMSSVGVFGLFICLCNINWSNKWVNWIAASMLPVYLIHDGGNVGTWFYESIGQLYAENTVLSFAGYCLLSVVILFVVALIVDQPRRWLWKVFAARFWSNK